MTLREQPGSDADHPSGCAGADAIEVSVVIPVFNEAATLDELLDRLLAVLSALPYRAEVVLVDDGSRDESWAILCRRARLDDRIRPFSLSRNFASQAAVCAGLELMRGRWGVIIDADLENCPEDIPALLAPLQSGHDLVCGYRLSRPLRRRIPSWLVNRYVRHRTGFSVRDIGCGMRAFDHRVVRDLAAAGEDRRLLTPLFLQRSRKVAEVPIRPGRIRPAGGHSFTTLLGIVADYYLVTARRPFLSFAVAAFAVLLAGLLSLLVAPGVLPGVACASGALGLLAALVGEYAQQIYRLMRRQPFYELQVSDERRVISDQPPEGC
ncbi:MAG TPA: glycosyltransferase family 2 protein [Terriglobales bacterium]|nr:glycosyltransferase family 2 protein [Terriglobales bacterium]